jgi:hypothetical protein
MKNIVLKFYIGAMFFCSTILIAQPGSSGNGTDGLEGADTPAPIDDYVWVLALVGLVFIFMKFRAIQKNKVKG